MNNELNLDARTLGKGRIRRIHESHPFAHRVECLSGALWITQDGDLRRFVNVYVSGEDIRFQQGLDTAINDGDEVTILPAVAGG